MKQAILLQEKLSGSVSQREKGKGTGGMKNRNKLFYQMIKSYILISLLPLCLLCGICYVVVDELMEKELQRNYSGLQNVAVNIDYELSEIDRLSGTLQNDINLKWLYQKDTPLELEETYAFLNSVKIASNHMFQVPVMEECYIVLDDLNMVIGGQSTYRLQDFYGSIFQDEDKTLEEWRATFKEKRCQNQIFQARDIALHGSREKRLLYYTTVPLSFYARDTRGVIMMILSGDHLLKAMDNGTGGSSQDQYIVDSAGNIVLSSEEAPEFALPESVLYNREDVAYATLKDYNWTLAVVTSEKNVAARVRQVQFWIICVILAGSGVCVFLTWYMARRNMQPIKKIMGVLGVSKENQDNEYDSIMDSVQNLLVNNQNLESCLEDALPLAREEFWKKLLYGRIFQEESIENGRRQLGLTELGREYLIEVIYLNLEGAYTTQYLQECAVYRLMIHNFYKDMGAVFCIDHAETCVVVLAACTDPEHWKNIMADKNRELEEVFGKQYHRELKLFGMESCHGELDIYNAFTKELEELERYQERAEDGLKEQEGVNDLFYTYPIEVENRLINFIRIGNLEETDKLLDKIYAENLTARSLSVDMIKNLFLELRGTALKAFVNGRGVNQELSYELYEVNRQILKIKSKEEAEKVFDRIRECFREISNVVGARKTVETEDLTQRILAYIEEHLEDTQLGLSMVAEAFGMSGTNLSHYFKNKTGRNFSEYVESLRIDKAYDMIQNTQLSLDEIARRCGYGSNDSFRRAFTRCRGILPSKVRK